ncbi:glyoxylate/hydroxypyruvate reductase B [Clostridium puniceum]|uniref:Glyoxylate/hydroxypyruvate reductase B n=1 Tax=Clostridium puniceum TaxID=29367 RepID=A0A1S8T836_9CLOT|nr:D-glycerate dehydrogenase [Clostridium puniceum]OOM73625.1 glyoxylate/hydroxypyruvate reductase B [Clostridium puniceum]
MNRPKVYIARKIPYEVEEYIGKFCDYEKWGKNTEIPQDELFNRISDKDGVMLYGIKIDEALLDHAPKLKIVSNISAGYNNFNLEVMKRRNIMGTNTPGILNDTVADLVFGLILCSARKIVQADSYVKNCNWTHEYNLNLLGKDVHHSTLGIIGMGNIGTAVAKRAKLGFDMNVIYYNRNRKPEVEKNLGIQYCEFESLIKTSDFIVLLTPLTKDTYHLIDFKEFAMMKKSAILINASRGQIVNEEALVDALQNQKILGAGLDVYETEPIGTDNPLIKIPNVITLPHIGSGTSSTLYNMVKTAALNLVKGSYGEIPPNLVPELIK